MDQGTEAVTPRLVWVLTWRYHDGSGMGVIRVYYVEHVAKRDLRMLNDQSAGRVYELHTVDLISAFA